MPGRNDGNGKNQNSKIKLVLTLLKIKSKVTFASINSNLISDFLLFRAVEIQRIYETAATPEI